MFEVVDIGHGHYFLFLDPQDDHILSCVSSEMGLRKAKLLEAQITILLQVQRANFESRFTKDDKGS